MNITNKKALIAAKRDLTYPFTIPLKDGSQLICEKTLRILPGKRLTLQGKWQGKNVVAKIFLAPHGAKKYANRDRRGIEALHHYKFNAPEILFAGQSTWKNVHVLIYELITSSQKVKNVWHDAKDLGAKNDLMSKLAQTLARQHAVGLWQEDLHLNNFLLKRGKVYCLDGDGICFSKKAKPLSLNKSFHNLAMLIEHLINHQSAHIKKIFIEYCAYRNIPTDEKHYKKLLNSIQAVRHYLHKKQMEKTLRDCSSFVCKKSARKFLVYDRNYDSPAMQKLLENPEQAFSSTKKTFLKQGNSSTIITLTIDGHHFVIKRYNIKNPIHQLKRLFQETRARRSWLSAHYLNLLSVNTIKPIAIYEKKLGPCHFSAYFIAEYHTGKFINELSLDNAQDRNLINAVADDLVRQLTLMFAKRITHGDLKASNILVENGKITWLDLDAVKWNQRKQQFNHNKDKDLKRFLQNFAHDTTLYDFWQKRINQEFSE